MGNRGNYAQPKLRDAQGRMVYEDESDDRLSDLHGKVASLKAITIEIGNEVKEQNSFLDNMGLDFGSAEGLLGGTMKNLKQLSQTEQGRNYLFCTVLFVLFVFFLLYWIM